MIITQDMLDFIRLLKHHKVKYVIVGGFAVIYYGYIRTTQDFDILVFPSLENAQKMIHVLNDFGFGNAGFPQKVFEKEGTAIHLGAEPNRIDILTSLKTVSNATIFSNMKRIHHKGFSMNVISFEDLLACKKHSTRPKDLADVDVLKNTTPKKARIANRRKPTAQ
jgi:predicted nucleotidyltransferase